MRNLYVITCKKKTYVIMEVDKDEALRAVRAHVSRCGTDQEVIDFSDPARVIVQNYHMSEVVSL